MKLCLFICFLSVASASAAQSSLVSDTAFINNRRAKIKTITGKQLPLFNVKLGGTVLTNKDIKDKVVFINFWEKDCKPCMAEMQTLNRLYDTLKNDTDFLFLSFTTENIKTIQHIKEQYRIAYKIVSVTEDECDSISQLGGYPVSLIVNKGGNVVYVKDGGLPDKKRTDDFFFNTIYPILLSELKK